MDIENELEEFKKQHTPALVGASIRDLSIDSHPSSRSSSRPVVKNVESRSNMVTLADLKAEGGLIDDSEGQLDEILDASGHIKEEIISDAVKMKDEKASNSCPVYTVVDDAIDDKKINVFGGHGEEFVVPASGKESGYQYKSTRKSNNSHANLVQDRDIILPQRMMSVDDILEEVNTGEFEEKKKRSAASLNSKLSKMMQDIQDLDFDIAGETEEQLDPDFTPPAARREGSRSQSRNSVPTMQESRGRSLPRQGSGVSQPHLARGDSYHGGLNDENIHHPISSTPSATYNERQPRHDPGHGPRISNSSLSYLRSISRSRSRIANDRKALGEDTSLAGLKESGALTNDAVEGGGNGPDYEDAVKKALEFVDSTNHAKSTDALSSLADVKEEEDSNARNRAMNTDDLLDQLADSAKELMVAENKEDTEDINDIKEEKGPEEEKIETEKEDDEREVEEEKKEKEEKEEKEEVNAKETEDSMEEEKTLKSDISLEGTSDQGDETSENIEIVDDDKVEGITEDENVISAKADSNIDNGGNTSTGNADISKSAETGELSIEEEDESSKEDEEFEGEKHLNIFGKPAIPSQAQEETELSKTEMLDEDTEDALSTPQSQAQETETTDDDDIEALLAAAMKEQAGKGRSFNKDDELEVLVAGAVKEEKDKKDHAEFDEIVAAVAREKAVNSKDALTSVGGDGSVFVPKPGKMTFEDEPVFLYTSLAGGFQIHNRTNRVITILTVNKIPYTVRDLGTDEEAKSIWRRYCGGKTLPGIIRGKDDFIGNWQDVEDANENYAIRSLIYESY